MVNYIFRVIGFYEDWANGRELSESEIYEASSLLGAPTRKLDVFLSRFRDVFGQVIEERCCEVGDGRVCIYSWSRKAFKRYFPAALDANGTIIFYARGEVKLISYPLHRAFDLGVRGVQLPNENPSMVTPRIDGWHVNLYWDPILNRWAFSTRYVLHNMVYVRGDLKIEEYGLTVNPIVSVAEDLASRMGLYQRLGEYKGWTFTLMIEGSEPATWVKGPPEMGRVEEYNLVLLTARKPSGELLDPIESSRIAEALGLRSVAERLLEVTPGIVEKAKESIEYPSLFLWYLSRGDKEHPEVYEVKSEVYEDYINVIMGSNAKSYILLVTSGSANLVSKLREKLGDQIVDETLQRITELETVLREAVTSNPEETRRLLRTKGLKQDVITSIFKAVEEGKAGRALRILLSTVTEGWRVEDTPLIISNLVDDLRLTIRGL